MTAPDLSGRTALVTGSAKGIGRELLLAIADCGADVAVNYRSSADDAAAVADRAREAGVEATTVQGDVTDPDSVDGMFAAVEDELGTVDVAVNNVGAFAPEHWAEMDLDTWNLVLDTNLTGTYLCSKRALDGMRDQGGAASSTSATPPPNRAGQPEELPVLRRQEGRPDVHPDARRRHR